jgi:SAM-dependent methyltransferase
MHKHDEQPVKGPADNREPLAPSALGALLSCDTYLRERNAPRRGDVAYLYLSDLLAITARFAQGIEGDVLDYGCGGSPYRRLFDRARKYVGADIERGPNVDLVLTSDGKTGEPADSYDAVLSSQVLEHLGDPVGYLDECRRILKPGGKLLLTTHGMFEEHGCPDDYFRWTGRGLKRTVEAAGLEVIESFKLTTQTRGAIQIFHQLTAHLRCPERRVLHLLFALARKAHSVFGLRLLNWLGDRFKDQQQASGDGSASLYLGVAVIARKPM